MLNEDITDIGTVKAERIRDAVEKAREAFGASLAASFPEVTTGDLGPDVEIAWEQASNSLAVTWLTYNHPSQQPLNFSRIGELLSEKGVPDVTFGYAGGTATLVAVKTHEVYSEKWERWFPEYLFAAGLGEYDDRPGHHHTVYRSDEFGYGDWQQDLGEAGDNRLVPLDVADEEAVADLFYDWLVNRYTPARGEEL